MHMSLLDAVKLAVSPSGCKDKAGQVGSLRHISMAQTHQDLMEKERSHFGQGLGGTSKNWGSMQYVKNPTLLCKEANPSDVLVTQKGILQFWKHC